MNTARIPHGYRWKLSKIKISLRAQAQAQATIGTLLTGAPTGGHRIAQWGGGGGLYPQPPDRVPLGWDGLDTHPYPKAPVTHRIDTLEESQTIGSGRALPQRATRGRASFAEGRAHSPPRPI